MVGFSANRRGGRLPSFILIGLMVIIAILSFNYWSVSNKHGRLLDELSEVQTQVKRTDAARSRLEKRNSELMVQVDSHRKQIEQKDGDFNVMEGKLQAREALIKKCTDEKIRAQNDLSAQLNENQRMKEQLKDMRSELMKLEETLREVKKNNTHTERKLEYESLQCGRQIAQLKDDYEEKTKTLESQAAELRKSLESQRVLAAAAGAGAVEGGADGEGQTAGERLPQAIKEKDHTDLKAPEEMGKPGSDAGMPGIEDSEVGKLEDIQFGLKKPSITQKQGGGGGAAPLLVLPPGASLRDDRGGGMGGGAGPGPGAGVGPAPPAPGVPVALEGAGVGILERPDLPQGGVGGGGVEARGGVLLQHQVQVQQQAPQAQGDRPILIDEDTKTGDKMHADELGEQRRQLRAPDVKLLPLDAKANLALPPNPAQVLPNPIEPRHAPREPGPAPAEPPRHRQNDDERDLPGDRGVDYGKRHQANEIL
ncbi:protein GOLM2 isoform X2 [Engraulis encrasicolus]|uniref:protein GOLM2 isoform X2 n=1 Tax=Engraulis encrasicolus TaxID=184585 RepID=UPI002FD25E52